jgi:hypothetical protein
MTRHLVHAAASAKHAPGVHLQLRSFHFETAYILASSVHSMSQGTVIHAGNISLAKLLIMNFTK